LKAAALDDDEQKARHAMRRRKAGRKRERELKNETTGRLRPKQGQHTRRNEKRNAGNRKNKQTQHTRKVVAETGQGRRRQGKMRVQKRERD
jgi:hypothetical protein